MTALIRRANRHLGHLPPDAILLALRVFIALVFLMSGRTKVDGLFTIKDATWFLFENEYALPLIPSDWAAVLATIGEHVLPAMMILGIGSRFSAIGLLLMTAVIQVFVYPSAWPTHGLWAAGLLAVAAFGPGRLSLDHLAGLDSPAPRPWTA
jgi:putative oxidoreductase